MKPEAYEVGGLDKEDIDLIYEKARVVLDRESLKETEFIDPYGEANVQADLEEVARLEKVFAAENNPAKEELKKIAEIFEALVLQNGELNEWFGSKAFTLKTSKYDDYVNGIDEVIEFREGDSASYMGLAMDVTFTSNPYATDSITNKFNKLLERIKRGKLPDIKYFHSAHMRMHGRFSDVPEVVIGVDKKTVLEVAELWSAGKNSLLARHKIQIMILQQMKEQIKFFANYAHSFGDDRHYEIAAIYDRCLPIIEDTLNSKEDLVREIGREVESDPVHSQIMEFLELKQAA